MAPWLPGRSRRRSRSCSPGGVCRAEHGRPNASAYKVCPRRDRTFLAIQSCILETVCSNVIIPLWKVTRLRQLLVREVFSVSKTLVSIRSSLAVVGTIWRLDSFPLAPFLLAALVLCAGCVEQASQQL